jgi:anaerobic ribonucleoside-triphosphate reductase activating protein
MEEIPDKITLAVNISNCLCRCEGCHTAYLRKDIGDELTPDVIDNILINDLKYCNCFLFLGEGNDRDALFKINQHIKENFNIETAVYSGRDSVEKDLFDSFDYVKVGGYKKEFGPLNVKTTNQKLYYHGNDITHKMWL